MQRRSQTAAQGAVRPHYGTTSASNATFDFKRNQLDSRSQQRRLVNRFLDITMENPRQVRMLQAEMQRCRIGSKQSQFRSRTFFGNQKRSVEHQGAVSLKDKFSLTSN